MPSSKPATPATEAVQYFSREQILKAMARATKDVPFAAVGGKVRIRELSVQQRFDLAQKTKREDGTFNEDLYRAWKIRFGVIDPSTLECVFTDEDIPFLADMHEADTIQLCNEIDELSEVGLVALKSVDSETDAG